MHCTLSNFQVIAVVVVVVVAAGLVQLPIPANSSPSSALHSPNQVVAIAVVVAGLLKPAVLIQLPILAKSSH